MIGELKRERLREFAIAIFRIALRDYLFVTREIVSWLYK